MMMEDGNTVAEMAGNRAKYERKRQEMSWKSQGAGHYFVFSSLSQRLALLLCPHSSPSQFFVSFIRIIIMMKDIRGTMTGERHNTRGAENHLTLSLRDLLPSQSSQDENVSWSAFLRTRMSECTSSEGNTSSWNMQVVTACPMLYVDLSLSTRQMIEDQEMRERERDQEMGRWTRCIVVCRWLLVKGVVWRRHKKKKDKTHKITIIWRWFLILIMHHYIPILVLLLVVFIQVCVCGLC